MERPISITRFPNYDETKHSEGYNSEGEQFPYDPDAIEEDADKFVEEAIQD